MKEKPRTEERMIKFTGVTDEGRKGKVEVTGERVVTSQSLNALTVTRWVTS